MALSGSAIGSIMAAAVGAPASAGGMFAALGTAIQGWAVSKVTVVPTTMAAVGGVVSGLGIFTVTGDAVELGGLLADALTLPVDATSAREVWIATAQALIDHFTSYGQVNGTGFTSGVPLAGAGTVVWTSPVFVPPLAVRIGVSDPVAGALLALFEAQLLLYIQTNANVVSVSLSGPPMSAPTDGPVAGTGTIV